MKKLLGIFGFGLLFILIDLVTPAKVEACHNIFGGGEHSAFEKLKCKAESALDDVNPLNYLEKRKECKEWADRADTVYNGKRRYKSCMEE